MSTDPISASGKRLRRLTIAAAVVTIAVFTGLVVAILRTYQGSQRLVRYQTRVMELVGTIVHLDEVLTMSARMAAATGDAGWEARYRHYESTLDGAIKEARQLAAGRLGEHDIAQTDAANLRLVELEYQAFDLARAGRLEEARTVLFGPEYESQKTVYAQGVERLTSALRAEGERAFAAQRWTTLSAGLTVVAALGFLLGTWLFFMRTTRRWQTALLQRHQELEQKAQDLHMMNRNLDARIAERTWELSQANESLKAEVANRETAEHTLAEKVRELETLNATMLGREERVLEMKKEVNDLLKMLGREMKYSV
jgi:hypothetical protein